MVGRQLRQSVIWNVGEVIGSSLVLYVIYRVVVHRLGLEALGIWTLVVSATSVARMADVGAASGLSRYIAMEIAAPGNNRGAMPWIQTAFWINLILYSTLAAILYLPAYWGLARITTGPATETARALLPYSIASFTLASISGVGSAALTGFGRGDLKSKLTLVGLAVQAVTVLLLIKPLGLIGVAVAQVIQSLAMLVGSWMLIRRLDAGGSSAYWPFRNHRSAFRALIGFGTRLQGLNILTFMFDPATKFVFSATGGLASVALYEIASRTILQVRQLVVMPAQNLTPLYAAVDRSRPQDLARVYSETSAYTMLTAAAAMGATFVCSPLLSYVWLAKMDRIFIIFTMILSSAWFINIVATPSYLLGIALGHLRWNVVGTVVFALGAPLLGYLLHPFGGQIGVVVGIAIGAAAGGIITIWANPGTLGIPVLPNRETWREILRRIVGIAARRLR